MSGAVVLALDQGTTSSRAIVFDGDGRPLGIGQKELSQSYPQPGWVEHDANEIWSTQSACAKKAVAEAGGAHSIAAIGITNQRETTVVWDRATLQPIAPAIVWQDRRTAAAVDAVRARPGAAELVRERSGLELDAYFSASKLAWLLEHTPGAGARAERGELAFGTIDSWLVARLTRGEVHVTDVSNASRTMLFDLHRLDWDDDLLDLWGIPRALLPRVVGSSEIVGHVADGLPCAGSPIAGIAGDQQAATFGQACFATGQAKATYGTGAFLVLNAGTEPVPSHHRLLSTVAWKLPTEVRYALEGSIFVAGAVVQWLRDGLRVIDRSEDVEALATSVPDSGGVVFVPAFAGLGAPQWDPYARGTIVGITRGTTAAHLARAALEAIAFSVADVLDAMEADAPVPIQDLRVDGGAARNDLLMECQADVLGRPVVRPAVTETTALGAAFLAGLATGMWPDQDAVAAMLRKDRTFEPTSPRAEIAERRARWRDAVERSRGWATP
ncbi:MAG: glycerol kinase GlpK [Trueperaceae bacterium]